ncbi:hypothetical protein DMUE_0922 [Dictyocoela muelleri]|nr:hypothetical protein DMUE_0922 [Dictyocoela muelleri]
MYSHLLSFFRSKISNYVKENRRQIGGNLKEVQIDETFYARRKYNVGDIGTAVWIFGAIEFNTGYCYCQIVENMDVRTLHPIIWEQIKAKSFLYRINGEHTII